MDTDLADCMEWTLLQDDVAANFSSDSTDGWDGDYMGMLFSNGIQYVCPLGGTVDLPHSPYHVSQCSEGMYSITHWLYVVFTMFLYLKDHTEVLFN